ncbi:MAG TPA: cation:proton antiporter [Longimicrobiales bacterium]|nr:cation:proton antiporter [Longimicrobiales bacterium]
MHLPLLTDIVVLLGVSLGVLYASHWIRVPPIVGFLVTGVILGPHGLAVIQGVHEVEQLAEIGVILVLFAIGLEFSLADLLRMRRAVLLGGSIQLFGVLGLVFGGLVVAGMASRQALFLGMIASLSSTAVVLRLLQQRAEVDAPHGRTALAVLVYQDLMIVPMMLLIPVLSGAGGGLGPALLGFAAKAVVVLIMVFVLARFVVPRVLQGVVATRSRDMFLVAVVTICLLVAWVGAEAGLSLALGAFLAGLIVSESEYSHQALSDILPFRDLFASFFFVSIGMLLDVRLVLEAPLAVAGLVLGVLALKGVAAGLATTALGLSLRTAVLAGVALSQVGEFSFILAGSGMEQGLMSAASYQWFLVVAVVSIALTPFLIAMGPRMAEVAEALPIPPRLKAGALPESEAPSPGGRKDHLLVVGFGVNGGNVARAAQVAGIPLVAIEMNPTVVQKQRALGLDIHYGDAGQAAVLEHAGVKNARVAVVAISDAAATRRIVALLRSLSPSCHIVARTRYLREVDPLRAAGAHLVIPEELETSVEIVARVLAAYLVPRRDIEGFLAEMRAGGYEMLRTPHAAFPSVADLQLALSEIEISTLRVDDDSLMAGRRLDETDLRRLFGITVVAIRRGEEVLANPGGDTVVDAGDALIVLGLSDEVNAASAAFRGAGPEPS